MAFFDADLAVNNSELNELNIFKHKTENGEKKGILYFSRGDVTIEMAAVVKNNGGIEKGNDQRTCLQDRRRRADLGHRRDEVRQLPRVLHAHRRREARQGPRRPSSRARTPSGGPTSTMSSTASRATIRSTVGAVTTPSTVATARTNSSETSAMTSSTAAGQGQAEGKPRCRHLRLRSDADQHECRHGSQVQRTWPWTSSS